MNFKEAFLNELDHESKTTRKFIERVPLNHLDYKPHAKSMALGKLATHIVEIVSYWDQVLQRNELNFASKLPIQNDTLENLLRTYDYFIELAKSAIQNFDEDKFLNPCDAKMGDTVFFTMPIYNICRITIMNHWIHHRAQLGIYFRQLDIAVPGAYGPSGDEG